MKTALHQRIAAWLDHSRHSDAAVARSIGVSRSAVSHWRSGQSAPTHDNLTALADAIGISVARFYGPLPRDRR